MSIKERDLHHLYSTTTTLNNCDREPIHIPCSIQSYGWKMGRITQATENCAELFQKKNDHILNANFLELMENNAALMDCWDKFERVEKSNALYFEVNLFEKSLGISPSVPQRRVLSVRAQDRARCPI